MFVDSKITFSNLVTFDDPSVLVSLIPSLLKYIHNCFTLQIGRTNVTGKNEILRNATLFTLFVPCFEKHLYYHYNVLPGYRLQAIIGNR